MLMSKSLCVAFLTGLLVLSITSRPAPAKAATVKIIISGPNLPAPIEVTDEQILALSNVWAGQFLDGSRSSPDRPSQRIPFELAFYVKFQDSNPRLMYVAYYYPDRSSQRGYIYLPGRDEPWYYLNVGTILRSGQDGRWNYASPAWESLIKPVITHVTVEKPGVRHQVFP